MPSGPAATAIHEQNRPPSLLVGSPKDRRPHPRAELALPVRLRWLGPFGLETEITQSWNVCRSGVLVASGEPRHAGSLVWVTFPFDEESALAEPETPARVAWCHAGRGGIQMLGIAFDARNPAGGNGYLRIPRGAASVAGSNTRKYFEIGERRRRKRFALAMFVHVSRTVLPGTYALSAHEDAPWPEETMTVNVSHSGVLFSSLRIYEAGDRLTVTYPKGAVLPDGERLGRVVHVAPLDAESPLLCVGAEFFSFRTRKS
jgi:hypothetical protein